MRNNFTVLSKVLSGVLAFGIGISAVAILPSAQVVAAPTSFDCKVETTPIKQLPAWCWITSAQMTLRSYLEDCGKLSKTEYIHEKYGEECLEATYSVLGVSKSMDEFEELYEAKLSASQKNSTNKETAFLVYLCSDYLESLTPFVIGELGNVAIDVVLQAIKESDKQCYTITGCEVEQAYARDMDGNVMLREVGTKTGWKIGLVFNAVKHNSALLSYNGGNLGGHYKCIVGLEKNEVLVQETGGNAVGSRDLSYMSDQHILSFIGNKSLDENFKIFHLGLDESGNIKRIYNKGERIYIAVTEEHDALEMLYGADGCLNFRSIKDIRPGYKISQLMLATVSDAACLNVYEAEVQEDGLDLLDLQDSILVKKDISDNLNGSGSGSSGSGSLGSGSSGSGSSGSGSSGSGSSGSGTSSQTQTTPATTAPIVSTYEFEATRTSEVDAVEVFKSCLTKDFDPEKVSDKENKAIVFNTNAYSEQGEKINLARWTFENKKLQRDFVEKAKTVAWLQEKVSSNKATEQEKQKLAQTKQEISDYNFKLTIRNTKAEESTTLSGVIKESLNGKNATVVDFTENKKFPGEAVVDYNMGKENASKTYIVIYNNTDFATGKTKNIIVSRKCTVGIDGYVRFKANHGANYIFLEENEENMKLAEYLEQLQ